MIINIRGTHGSGKSTIVRHFLTAYSHQEIRPEGSKKIEGYECSSPFGKLFIVGSYATACGGCDAIQPYNLIWPRIVSYATWGHVLFEGALVSSSYGNIGRASEEYGNRFVFAFLNTPMSVCLERIKQRREAKGNLKPLDPKNTQVKYDNIQKSIPKIRDEFKRRVVILDYRKPIPQLLKLLNEQPKT